MKLNWIRRQWVWGLVLCAVFAAATANVYGAGKTPQPPNILFIPIDDLKPMLGCYGDETIKTPNIDRLAKRGMVFLNNHCQQAVCGPSRASLMTGLYPDNTRVFDLATKMRDQNPDILTLPEYFKQRGYETTGLGKTYDSRCVDKELDGPSWSIPYSTRGENLILADGFDAPQYAYQHPETRRLNKELENRCEQEKKEGGRSEKEIIQSSPGARPTYECYDVPDDAYYDGARTAGAIKLLEKLAAADKPFFLSVGYQKPHLPFVAPKKYWDLYDPEKINLAECAEMPEGAPSIGYQPGWEIRGMYSDVPAGDVFPEAYQRTLIHGYMACVSYIDAQVGRLLDQLDELGIADNTIICLWGDHGWHLGDHNIWCKHTNFEQGTRSPLIVAAPWTKTKGESTESPTEFVDIFPTLCELAGLEIPSHLPGKSMVPLMDGEAVKVKDFAFSQYPRTPSGKVYMGYSLRDERYRYTAWYKVQDEKRYKAKKPGFGMESKPAYTELYDYETDPLETRNLAVDPKQAGRVAAYEKAMQEKIAEIAACKVNPDGAVSAPAPESVKISADAHMTLEEFFANKKAYCAKKGKAYNESMYRKNIAELDANGDGLLTPDEWPHVAE
ncbi:Choline-sulfatase [Pontiella desulfatans]|uniref:Choline-sulfatase n=1 Tax=Pontiella desulfatans TaxID=2750659 RepID=A0A6C2U6H8_PONDE|nr:sulfatase [Pontiella desulfatans]SPS73972.1 sulfatase S1_7 [Kiritimatiellales bacterium]VGO15407.1 Choline-sulfatase [Pontiella desulfatans]